MKLINPSVKIFNPTLYNDVKEAKLKHIFKDIEAAGRTCYKSEDKINDESAEDFVQMLINRKHYAMLEHGTVYLTINDIRTAQKYLNNKYSCNTVIPVQTYNDYFITTNYRVLVENGWLDDLKYLYNPTINHERRVSVRFVCDRGVSHELVRHRVFSFAQESTRYCNYSKDKFGSEITCVKPCWFDEEINEAGYVSSHEDDMTGYYIIDPDYQENTWIYPRSDFDKYVLSLCEAEYIYFNLLDKHKWQPQQARSVLPNSLKTEVVMTGFVKDWRHFFKLRTATTAHPQMRELAIPLEKQFVKEGLL